MIPYHWDVTPQLRNQREKIRIKLLNGVVLNADHPMLIETNSLILVNIINRDGPEKWKTMLEPMITWMNSDNYTNMRAGLDTFCFIFNGVDDRIHIIIPGLMNQLYQIYTKPEADEEIRKKV